ncbi:MAG: hypothetical protein V1744_00300 [Candidatus Altiarchaeota archaeon]
MERKERLWDKKTTPAAQERRGASDMKEDPTEAKFDEAMKNLTRTERSTRDSKPSRRF